ncbi:MAG: DUF1643 domain-containing protein [Glaciecola sp.]|nr:DUF1643 domain-containing protein [Glaciecola sp.]
MNKDAIVSDNQLYRYQLSRVWDSSLPMVMFICLNPSTADGSDDDPTILKCIKYARGWGYGGLLMGNLFAYRATEPSDMKKAKDPIGPLNNHHLKLMSQQVDKIVCGWGNHGVYLDRDEEVKSMFDNLYALRINKTGSPAHPLYLKKSLIPISG